MSAIQVKAKNVTKSKAVLPRVCVIKIFSIFNH
jgi:hypothetical protein